MDGTIIGTGETSGIYVRNEIVTVMADEPAPGMRFSHWEDSQGKILGYQTVYKFYASQEYAVRAIFVADDTKVESAATAQLVQVVRKPEEHIMSFVAMLTVPEGCTMEYGGILATNQQGRAIDAATGEIRLTKDTADYVRGNKSNTPIYRYTWTKTRIAEDETWYVRPYIVYKDVFGELHEIMGDMVTAKLTEE